MTVVYSRARWGWFVAVAVALLAFCASAGTEAASAHGNCTTQVGVPYKSPSGAQIRGTAINSCDYRHELVKVCVAVERFESGVWEGFGEAPNKCNPNANAYSAKAQVGRPCVSGTYRVVGKGVAEGANGHVHGPITVRGQPTVMTCPPTALLNTSADDLLFLAG